MTSLRNWYKGVCDRLSLNPCLPCVCVCCLPVCVSTALSLPVRFLGDDPNKVINPLVTGAFGAFAGAVSVFGNTPLDVIKTRMQVHTTIINDLVTCSELNLFYYTCIVLLVKPCPSLY